MTSPDTRRRGGGRARPRRRHVSTATGSPPAPGSVNGPAGIPTAPGHRAPAVRPSRRVLPATLLALALLAVAVLVAVSGVQELAGQPPWLPLGALGALGTELTAASPAVLAAAAALVLAGLVLLLAAVLPGAPSVLPLRADGEVDAGVTRRSLTGALTAAAHSVDGVDRAAVRVRARTVTATVRGPGGPELAAAVRTALTERLAGIGLARDPRVRVTIRST